MVAHMLFTKLMDALSSSYTNLGAGVPKNDATITRKKDDATVKLLPFYYNLSESSQFSHKNSKSTSPAEQLSV